MLKLSGKIIKNYKIRIKKTSDQGRFDELNPYEICDARNSILAKIYPNKLLYS